MLYEPMIKKHQTTDLKQILKMQPVDIILLIWSNITGDSIAKFCFLLDLDGEHVYLKLYQNHAGIEHSHSGHREFHACHNVWYI